MKAALIGAALAALVSCAPAAASGRHHHANHHARIAHHPRGHHHASRRTDRRALARPARAWEQAGGLYALAEGGNARMARARGLAWCGAYLADLYHFTGAVARRLWVAANWARIGQPASPHIGAVVVWRHHVGKIVGQEGGRWVVLSGNDGHRVRQRPRSLSGAIAIRDNINI